MNPIGYVAIEYSSGGSPMEVVDGVIRESAEDIREVAYGLNRIPGDERYEAAVIVHADDLERLTDERDADRAEIVQLCQERLDLTAERDSLKGLLSGSQQELRDAITAQGKAEAERDEVRAATLADAIEAVCGLQIRDASRFAEHHGHGGWCKGGTAPDECHGAEAHATANRVLDTLRALRPGGAAPAGGARHCPTCRCGPIPVCATPGCNHLDVMHDLPKRKAGYVRTGCSVSTGPKATPCPCTAYTPAEEP